MYTIRFRFVQLMYRTLRGFKQSVPKLVVGVQTCLFGLDTVYDVGKDTTSFRVLQLMYRPLQGC